MQVSQNNSSTSIYLEQIQNFIDLAQGYNSIRAHLFRELYKLKGDEPIADDRL